MKRDIKRSHSLIDFDSVILLSSSENIWTPVAARYDDVPPVRMVISRDH